MDLYSRVWGILVGDGSDRKAVEYHQEVHSARPQKKRSAGPALERPTASLQRDFVDFAHGRALERFAAALRSVSDCASAFSSLAKSRGDRSGVARVGSGFGPAGRTRSFRMFFRRQLQRGQKGGAGVGATKRGKGCKIMALGDAHGLPIALYTEAAAPAEVSLTEATLAARWVREKPLRIIADKAFDSDSLRQRLLKKQMLLLSPHRRGRKSPCFNDRRWMRRYRKRWKIERLFAWLHNFRRLVIRWEYHAANYLAFLQLGCAIILLRYL